MTDGADGEGGDVGVDTSAGAEAIAGDATGRAGVDDTALDPVPPGSG